MFYVIHFTNFVSNKNFEMSLFAENKEKALKIFLNMYDSDNIIVDYISENHNILIKEVVS